jgi:hypothetical protein
MYMENSKIRTIVRKSLADLYKQQYGENPSNSFELGLDSVLDDMQSDSYWKGFQVDYSQLETKGLMGLLHSARKDLDQIKDTGHTDYIESLIKIITALKAELATREHIPNKKEREVIRQQKFKDKKNR